MEDLFKKIECVWWINIGTLLLLSDWRIIGGYPFCWWKARYRMLRNKK